MLVRNDLFIFRSSLTAPECRADTGVDAVNVFCPTIMAQLLPPWRVFGNAGGLVDKVVEQRLGMGGGGTRGVSDSYSSQCLSFCQCEYCIPV